MTAGIQNWSILSSFMAKSPKLLAIPELNTMLTPKRLASISVTFRPSMKLKITPHMHPSERPLKNIAAAL